MIEEIRPFLATKDKKNLSLHIATLKGEKMLHIQLDTKEWTVSLNPDEKEKHPTILDIPLTPLEILESIIN